MYNKRGYTEVQPYLCQLCNWTKPFGIISDIHIISLQSAYLHNLGKNSHMFGCVIIKTIPIINRDVVLNIKRTILKSGATHQCAILFDPESHSEGVRKMYFRFRHRENLYLHPIYHRPIKKQPPVCQFIKWHKTGCFMFSMNYNKCNKQRWVRGSTTEQLSPPPLRKNNIRHKLKQSNVPVHKVAQDWLTILMRNRYRIWMVDLGIIHHRFLCQVCSFPLYCATCTTVTYLCAI